MANAFHSCRLEAPFLGRRRGRGLVGPASVGGPVGGRRTEAGGGSRARSGCVLELRRRSVLLLCCTLTTVSWSRRCAACVQASLASPPAAPILPAPSRRDCPDGSVQRRFQGQSVLGVPAALRQRERDLGDRPRPLAGAAALGESQPGLRRGFPVSEAPFWLC